MREYSSGPRSTLAVSTLCTFGARFYPLHRYCRQLSQENWNCRHGQGVGCSSRCRNCVLVHPGHPFATYRVLREIRETPAELLSRITCGIWFGGGNIRQRSICGIRFYARYAIAPLPFSAVCALDYRRTRIAVIALEWVCGCRYPPSWWGLCRTSLFGNPIHSSQSSLLMPPPRRLAKFRTCACRLFQEFILPTPVYSRLVVGVR